MAGGGPGNGDLPAPRGPRPQRRHPRRPPPAAPGNVYLDTNAGPGGPAEFDEDSIGNAWLPPRASAPRGRPAAKRGGPGRAQGSPGYPAKPRRGGMKKNKKRHLEGLRRSAEGIDRSLDRSFEDRFDLLARPSKGAPKVISVERKRIERAELESFGPSVVRPPRGERLTLRRRSAEAVEHPTAADAEALAAQRAREVRIWGLNACLAVVRDRIDAVRKVYLSEERAAVFEALLAWCRQRHVGYRFVGADDLARLTGSVHHEGICLDIERKPQPSFEQLLDQARGTSDTVTYLWLDGVANPHNFGAILRSAAHFGVQAVLLSADSTLTLAGSVYRVAEGGAERTQVVRLPETAAAIAALKAAGFTLLAADVHAEPVPPTFAQPQRVVLVIGAEGSGLSPVLLSGCDLRLAIPGSGEVESLNAATSAAILLAQRWQALGRSAAAPSAASTTGSQPADGEGAPAA